MSILTHSELIRLLSYDAKTGIFVWKANRGTRKVGNKAAGSKTTRGYINIKVNGISYQAHRLAWFYIHKKWPDDQIDHKNQIKSDNRIKNLR